MKMLKKASVFIVHLLPYLLVFVSSLYLPNDPDLGWHLKYGEYFFQHGEVLRDNTFSVLMPDYHWVNHSWGTDILTYFIFHFYGFLGLAVAAALIITATFFVFSKAMQLSLWEEALLFPLLLFFIDPVSSISFRSQLLSLFFLGVMFWIISVSQRKNQKYLFLLLPLFFIWANIHGEFILGLAIFSLWIALTIIQKIFQNKIKINKEIFTQGKFLFFIICLITAITLINPFGIGIYTETFRHLGNPMQKYIAEWTPTMQFSKLWWHQIVMGVFMFMGIVFIFFGGKFKDKFVYIFIAGLFFALSFWARRYAWPAYYLILPLLQPLTMIFKPNSKKVTTISSAFLLIIFLIIALAGKYPFQKFTSYSWSEYCNAQVNECSAESAEFIKNHKLTNNLFSQYSWGGWLIWNYPEIKPTIDGRMSFWKDEKGYSGFADYYWYVQNLKEIDDSTYDVVYIAPTRPLHKQMIKLVKEKKWRMVYRDNYASVFIRRK